MTVAIPTANHSKALTLPAPTDSAALQLVEWAQAADAAYHLAEVLCSTKFVPAAYRGKPQEGAAAILAGAEVGLSPMASMRAFDDIQGTPAPKAITLRAIVQGAGHEVRIVESTPTQAVVTGRRKGDTDWQTSTWDLARADKMGLLGKDQWKKQPDAMLVARATSEVCRWIASDAIMGMPYSAEEIRDQGPAFEGRGPARRVTAAEILDATDTRRDDGDAEEVPPRADVSMVSRDQQKRMFALWGDLGFVGDENRGNRLAITARILGLDEVASSSDLTAEQADLVIGALEDRKRQQAQTDGGEQS